YAFALLMPTLAILGALEGGRQVMALVEDPAWVAQFAQDHPRSAPADAAFLDDLVVWVRCAFVAALLAVLAARMARWYWERRRGAAPDVRLACQLRPHGDVRVTPLLPATAQARDGFSRPGYLHGAEREIVILFGDLRSFTQLSEKKLPYDLVFLLNRYFAETGHRS